MILPESKILTDIHIEKNAGTAVQDWLQRTYGKAKVFLFNPLTDSLIPANQLIDVANPIINWIRVNSAYSVLVPVLQKVVLAYVWKRSKTSSANLKDIENEQVVIHGHFAADKFDNIFPNALQAVVIGDPWKRMESHFLQWYKVRGQSNQRVTIPFDGTMRFEDFATLPELRNYQTQALVGKDLQTFAAVGTPECLQQFTQRIFAMFPPPGHLSSAPILKVLNKTPKNRDRTGPVINPPTDFHREFEQWHSLDYQIYRQAKEIVSNYA